jgi:hypothetical protein
MSASSVISKLTNAASGIAIRDSINILTAQRYAQPPSHTLKGFVRCTSEGMSNSRQTLSKIDQWQVCALANTYCASRSALVFFSSFAAAMFGASRARKLTVVRNQLQRSHSSLLPRLVDACCITAVGEDPGAKEQDVTKYSKTQRFLMLRSSENAKRVLRVLPGTAAARCTSCVNTAGTRQRLVRHSVPIVETVHVYTKLQPCSEIYNSVHALRHFTTPETHSCTA